MITTGLSSFGCVRELRFTLTRRIARMVLSRHFHQEFQGHLLCLVQLWSFMVALLSLSKSLPCLRLPGELEEPAVGKKGQPHHQLHRQVQDCHQGDKFQPTTQAQVCSLPSFLREKGVSGNEHIVLHYLLILPQVLWSPTPWAMITGQLLAHDWTSPEDHHISLVVF